MLRGVHLVCFYYRTFILKRVNKCSTLCSVFLGDFPQSVYRPRRDHQQAYHAVLAGQFNTRQTHGRDSGRFEAGTLPSAGAYSVSAMTGMPRLRHPQHPALGLDLDFVGLNLLQVEATAANHRLMHGLTVFPSQPRYSAVLRVHYPSESTTRVVER